MAADASPAPVLSYASPPRREGDRVEVCADPVQFHVGLPPVPTSLFVAMLAPVVILPPAVTAALVVVGRAMGEFGAALWLCLATTAVSSVVSIVRLSRHRHVERTVGATSAFVYFSDARTAGEPATLFRREFVDIRVRRSWWRPWIFELVAVPPRRVFVVSSDVPLEPVVLLIGLDRAVLERIAAGLRQVPGGPASAEGGVADA